MLDCWKNDPNERLNFEKLVKLMRTLTLMNKHQVYKTIFVESKYYPVYSCLHSFVCDQ